MWSYGTPGGVPAFNRTIVELKLTRNAKVAKVSCAFNRTIVELKQNNGAVVCYLRFFF